VGRRGHTVGGSGYATRYWAIHVDVELLAVTVYRKGVQAIADMLMRMHARKEAGDAAWIGAGFGVVVGPLGGIAGTLPGMAFGGLTGWLAADQFRRCAKCAHIFKT
jgi:hypothetical protein